MPTIISSRQFRIEFPSTAFVMGFFLSQVQENEIRCSTQCLATMIPKIDYLLSMFQHD